MKIAIDARTILNPEKNPAIGVGHYTYQLIRHLLDMDGENHYTLFFDYRVREKDVRKFSKKNVTIKYFPWSDYKKYLPGAYSEILGLATLSHDTFDVLHATSPDARVPLGYRGKVICTFQDLAVYKYPDLYHTMSATKAKYNRKSMAKRADKIIAVSENTKNDVHDLFGVEGDKVSVIHNGVDKRFFIDPSCSMEDLQKEFSRRFGITKKYFLFTGTLEPIKNIPNLLKAFRMLKDDQKEKGKEYDYQLVMAGKKGWRADDFVQNAKDLGLAEDVKFLGYVEAEDFVKLLKGAELFVMPSLYEGFGMTVLEALAVKAPCVVSEIGSLKEICSDSVEYCNPKDAKDIAKKIEMVLDDQAKKEEMKKKGYEQAKKFSWDRCAEKTLEIYKEVARK